MADFVGVMIRKGSAGMWKVGIRSRVVEVPQVCGTVTAAGEDVVVRFCINDLDKIAVKENLVSRIAEGSNGDE